MPPGGDQCVSRGREREREGEREREQEKVPLFLFGFELSDKCISLHSKESGYKKTSEAVKRLQIPPTDVKVAFYVLLTAL